MTSDRELLDIIRQSSATDLQVLISAKEEAKRKVLDDPTSANIQAFERAKQALDRVAGPADDTGEDQTFKDRMKVLTYLKNEGYKIGKQKIYNDSAAGLLKVQDDGTVLLADVKKYIKRTALKRLSEPGKNDSLIDQHTIERRELENEKLRVQVEDIKFRGEVAKGNYLPVEEFGMEVAARAGVICAGLQHMVDSQVAEWVVLAHEDPTGMKLREAIRRDINRLLSEFASMEQFHVVFDLELSMEDTDATGH